LAALAGALAGAAAGAALTGAALTGAALAGAALTGAALAGAALAGAALVWTAFAAAALATGTFVGIALATGLDTDAAVAVFLAGALDTPALLGFAALAAAGAGRLPATLVDTSAEVRLAGADLAGLPLAGAAPLRVLAAVIGNPPVGGAIAGGGRWPTMRPLPLDCDRFACFRRESGPFSLARPGPSQPAGGQARVRRVWPAACAVPRGGWPRLPPARARGPSTGTGQRPRSVRRAGS
jgi:hypothetical protein